ALGEYRREQYLLGRSDARVGQFDVRPVQSVGRGQPDALVALVHDRTEGSQGVQVEVDRAVTDPAAPEVWDQCLAEPVQQRTAEQDRNAAGARERVDLREVGLEHV